MPTLWMTVGGNDWFGDRPSVPAPPVAVAWTPTEGFMGSSLAIVRVAVCGPILVGLKVTSTGKQEPGAIVTGKPPDGGVMENNGFDEAIPLIDSGPTPVLQMVSVAWPTLPAQTVPKATLDGT